MYIRAGIQDKIESISCFKEFHIYFHLPAGVYLPDVIPNDFYVLKANSGITTPLPSETYTPSTMICHCTKERGHTIVTGLCTIIDDILCWSSSQSTLLM